MKEGKRMKGKNERKERREWLKEERHQHAKRNEGTWREERRKGREGVKSLSTIRNNRLDLVKTSQILNNETTCNKDKKKRTKQNKNKNKNRWQNEGFRLLRTQSWWHTSPPICKKNAFFFPPIFVFTSVLRFPAVAVGELLLLRNEQYAMGHNTPDSKIKVFTSGFIFNEALTNWNSWLRCLPFFFANPVLPDGRIWYYKWV